MKKDIGVLLVDSSEDFLSLLAQSIEEEPDLYVVGAARDGEEALSLALEKKPDVLVTEIPLRRLDGIGLIKELKSNGALPATIVVSAFFNDSIAMEAGRLGVAYCFPKPCRLRELILRIRECAGKGSQGAGRLYDYDTQITEALIRFGIMPHLQGYRYLREGVKRALEDESVLHGVTKILYPDLAKAFQTNSKCIERSMRNAVEIAWRNGGEQRRDDYFGSAAQQLTDRPTNTQFLTFIVEFILHKGENRAPLAQ